MTSDNLRAAIKDLEFSQRGLARALDVSERTVRHWCAGDYEVPKVVGMAVAYLKIRKDIYSTVGDR